MNLKQSLPNLVTLSRIFAVPFIIALLLMDIPMKGTYAAGVFILASLTDYFDGYLARKFKTVTNTGKFLDPLADKILVSSTLVMLIPSGKLGPIMVIILLGRDTFISGLRSVAASENLIIGAGTMGKWKTAIQMIAIPAVLMGDDFSTFPFFEIGYWTLWLSVLLSVISGAEYAYKYYTHKI